MTDSGRTALEERWKLHINNAIRANHCRDLFSRVMQGERVVMDYNNNNQCVEGEKIRMVVTIRRTVPTMEHNEIQRENERRNTREDIRRNEMSLVEETENNNIV